MSSCFSPSPNTSKHEHHPSALSTTQRLGDFIAVLIASLTRLASKLKPQNGGLPRKFVSNVNKKAKKLVHMRKHNNKNDKADVDEALWQRAILMGDKCQPLDFSGVIHYDQSGQQRSETPLRFPRTGSPLPIYP